MIHLQSERFTKAFLELEWGYLSLKEQRELIERALKDTGPYSIGNAMRKFEDLRKRYLQDAADKPPDMNASLHLIIYGNGGLHRFYVLASGSVAFSKRHGPEKVEKARKLGFEIFE